MPTMTVKTVETVQVKIKPTVRRKLLGELRAYGELSSQAKVLKHAMEGHRNNILEIGLETGEKKFELDGYKVALVTDAEDRRLDKVKLMKALVASGHYSVSSAQALLDAATTSKLKKAYAKVTVPGENDDE